MKNSVTQEAIANITSTSIALQKFCSDPKNYNSTASKFLDRVVWELSLQVRDLKDIQDSYGV